MKTRSQWLVAALALSVLCTVVGQLRSADGEKSAGGDLKNDAKPSALRRVGEEDIRKELAAPADLKFDNVLLSEIIPSIADKHHIEIQFDEAALKDASVDPSDIRISAEIRGVSLSAALEAILDQANLTCRITNEVLLITTTDRDNASLVVKIYDVHELLGRGGPVEGDYDVIVDLITSTIAAPTWDSVGGQGSIQRGPSETLIVSQTDAVLEQIADLLAALAKVLTTNHGGHVGDSEIIGGSPADAEIEKSLSNKVDLNFNSTSLAGVAERLAADAHLKILFDTAALKDAAIDPKAVTVTNCAKGISLRSALKIILSPLNLTYIITDEILLITTADKAGSMLTTRLYPIGDFGDAELLASNIRNTIAAPTWDEVGGQGTLAIVCEKNPVLAISQTQQTHAAIADFLALLREVIRHQPAHEKAEESPTLSVYDLKAGAADSPAMTPQEIVEVIKGLVAPKSWSQPDVYIRGVTGKLIVKHSTAVQKEIVKLLGQLGVHAQKAGIGFSRSHDSFGGGGF
jgi:hypothetical protein